MMEASGTTSCDQVDHSEVEAEEATTTAVKSVTYQPSAQLPCPPYYGVCSSIPGSIHWINWYRFLSSALVRWSRVFVDILDNLQSSVKMVELLSYGEDGSCLFSRQFQIAFHTGGLEKPKRFNTNGIIVCYGSGGCEFSGNGILIRSGSGRTLHSGSGIVIKTGSGPCTVVSNGILIDSGSGPISVVPSRRAGRFSGFQAQTNQNHPLVICGKKGKIPAAKEASVYRDPETGCVYAYEPELASSDSTTIIEGNLCFLLHPKCNFNMVKTVRTRKLTCESGGLQSWKTLPELTISTERVNVEDVNEFVYWIDSGLEMLEVNELHIVVRRMIEEVGFVLEIKSIKGDGRLSCQQVGEKSLFITIGGVGQTQVGFRVSDCIGNGSRSCLNAISSKGDSLICLRAVFK